MIRTFLKWFASKLWPPRVIMDREGKSPYLSRYYLFTRPKMANGNYPFDDHGNPKPEIIWPEGSLKIHLHKFHRGDDDMELHNHPWRWALSFVLAGGYLEERRIGVDVVTRIVKPFRFNVIRSFDFHRVDLLEDDAWTIFITGPREGSWGFWNRYTNDFTPFREFLARKREAS